MTTPKRRRSERRSTMRFFSGFGFSSTRLRGFKKSISRSPPNSSLANRPTSGARRPTCCGKRFLCTTIDLHQVKWIDHVNAASGSFADLFHVIFVESTPAPTKRLDRATRRRHKRRDYAAIRPPKRLVDQRNCWACEPYGQRRLCRFAPQQFRRHRTTGRSGRFHRWWAGTFFCDRNRRRRPGSKRNPLDLQIRGFADLVNLTQLSPGRLRRRSSMCRRRFDRSPDKSTVALSPADAKLRIA